MAEIEGERQLASVAVLFADISGSTAIYAERGDVTAFALTSECLGLLEGQAVSAGGRVVKRLGDGLLAVFENPVEAVQAAVQMRRALSDPACSLAREGVRVRMGVSCGRAVLDRDDVFGDVVNVAARLLSLAGSDEIFLSGAAYERLPASLRSGVRLIDQITLRNRPGSVLVYEYLGEVGEDATRSVGQRVRTAAATLEVLRGEHLFVVGPERPRLTFGRSAENDLAVEDDVVSRRHAEIILRGDRFVLTDRSTNGTYVRLEDGRLLRILREELPLTAGGGILLGSDTAEPILFRIA